MRISILLAVAATALAGAAASAPATNLVWGEAHSFTDVIMAWPTKAGSLKEGRAVLQCRIIAAGRLSNCDVIAEQPQGQGFGRAARGLVRHFQLKIDYSQLSPGDHFVNIPFHFINPNTAEGQAHKVSDPRWISMPDPARVQGAFPKAAADAGVKAGVGVIDCATAPDGRLTDCRVSREDPTGLGFGEAAMSVAPIMQMNPWTDDGRPVDGARVKLPIAFKLAGS
jgi:hypothetical protein